MRFGGVAPSFFFLWRPFCRHYAPVAALWSIAHVASLIWLARSWRQIRHS
ncbi:hypothetical protein A225_3497 [Klebsiella michiganensis E718]|nr:hypothetical protein A225_3497 [Klebsiella michiganensis E718]